MVELIVRLVFSLAVVVGLLLVMTRLGARRLRGGPDAPVRVVHRQSLSRTSAVAVVAVGNRVLVLGTTEQQVNVLAELDPEELLTGADLAGGDGFVASLSAVPEATPLEETALEDTEPGPQIATPTRPRAIGSHRADVPVRVDVPAEGVLTGSILSPQTWRQAFAAASRRAS